MIREKWLDFYEKHPNAAAIIANVVAWSFIFLCGGE